MARTRRPSARNWTKSLVRRIVRFQVRGNFAGHPVLDVLCTRFSFCDRAQWEAMIRDGTMVLNGQLTQSDKPVRKGDVLEYRGDAVEEPPVNRTIRLLHDDAHLVVVDKPACLPAHPGGRFFNNTLWAILKEEHGIETPIIINRLDRETSGVVLVARTREAEKSCRNQFERRLVDKRYIAIVEGQLAGPVEARGWIHPDPAFTDRKRVVFEPVDGEAGQRPQPGYDWSETLLTPKSVHGGLSCVEARPKTGRMHQIRATLTALGCPLVGDKLYGPDPGVFLRFCKGGLTATDRTALRLERQALHAASLRFRHPGTGQWVEFESALPSDMQALVGSHS